MKYFMKMAAGINTGSLLHELQIQPELWGMYDIRSQGPHGEAEDILLRYNRYNSKWNDAQKLEHVIASIDVVDYPAMDMLPEAQKLIFGLMAQLKGEHLGRVVISRLAPGKSIPLHSDRVEMAEQLWPDRPAPAVYYERYHVCLSAAPGSIFICGDEQVMMQTGELWWVNNAAEHAVINNSAEDRLHLVVDIRPWKPSTYMPEFD